MRSWTMPVWQVLQPHALGTHVPAPMHRSREPERATPEAGYPCIPTLPPLPRPPKVQCCLGEWAVAKCGVVVVWCVALAAEDAEVERCGAVNTLCIVIHVDCCCITPSRTIACTHHVSDCSSTFHLHDCCSTTGSEQVGPASSSDGGAWCGAGGGVCKDVCADPLRDPPWSPRPAAAAAAAAATVAAMAAAAAAASAAAGLV